LITSTKGLFGTGLRKCIPITLSGLPVHSASFVKLNVEVLETKIVSFFAILSISRNIFFFNSKSSSTASTIRSQPATSLMSVTQLIRLMIAFFSEAVIAHLLISLSILSERLDFA